MKDPAIEKISRILDNTIDFHLRQYNQMKAKYGEESTIATQSRRSFATLTNFRGLLISENLYCKEKG